MSTLLVSKSYLQGYHRVSPLSYLNESFYLFEFLNNFDGKGRVDSRIELYISRLALHRITLLADFLHGFKVYLRQKYGNDYVILINSGYRTPEHNKAVGGVSTSHHLSANACDFCMRYKHNHELVPISLVSSWLEAYIDSLSRYNDFVVKREFITYSTFIHISNIFCL